jgi:NAD(P)-dependent dehydrogenase (short-subunit alcohol dehydrogenase family)
VETGVDVTSELALGQLAERLDGIRLDLILLNAGILLREGLEELDFASMLRQFEVNALGPLRCVQALRGQLEEGSKIAIVTSRMGSIGDNTSGSRYGYRMSKAAVNMAGVSLARDLAPFGISVALLHPGYVRTDMTQGRGLVDAPEAARGLLHRIDELDLATSGSFWHANGEILPW